MALLPYVSNLETLKDSRQQVWNTRNAELSSLDTALKQLYVDVGANVEKAFANGVGEFMSVARIAEYKTEVARVESIKSERQLQISTLCSEINALWDELGAFSGAAPRDSVDECVARPNNGKGLGWTVSIISTLTSKCQVLQDEKAAREERIMVIGQQITALWKRLATPEAEQTSFLESHAGIGDDVITACEAYLSKKKIEFEERLIDLMAQARATISSLWDELRLGGELREKAFPAFFSPPSTFSDDLYASHEEFISTLSVQLEEARPILKAIEKRTAILGERAEYEALMADPQRLLAKGSSSARLREEKLERRVKKELPAVTKKLRQQVVEWEAAHQNQHLTVDGIRYLEILDKEEADETRHKEEARANRHKPVDAETEGASASASAAATHSSAAAAPAAPRSTSAPSARVVATLAKTGSSVSVAAPSAAPPTAPAAKPKPAGMKKPSAPATSSVAATSATVVDDDNQSTYSAAVNATENANPVVKAKAVSVAPPPLSAASTNIVRAPSSKSVVLASMSQAAKSEAEVMLASL